MLFRRGTNFSASDINTCTMSELDKQNKNSKKFIGLCGNNYRVATLYRIHHAKFENDSLIV